MKLFLPLLGLTGLVKSDFITADFDIAGLQILDAVMNNTDVYQAITSHGCWCAKLDPSADSGILGGPTPVDELDDICKKWFACRHCNDNLVGGTCSNSTVDMLQDLYEMTDFIFGENIFNATCNLQNSETNADMTDCAYDSCIIDAFYINQIYNYISINTDWVAQPVTDFDTCDLPIGVNSNKVCTGTAPDLRVVVTAPPTPVLATTDEQAKAICKQQVMDITFLVDGSGSMGTSGYAEAVAFTQTIVDLLDIEPNFTRVTIAQFSTYSKTYCEYCYGYDQVTNAITNMGNDFYRSSTYTGRALQHMYNLMTASSRPNSKQVFMILTDGKSSDGVSASGINYAATIQNVATSFAIGVTSGINMDQLTQIATDPDDYHLYTIASFSDFDQIKLAITSGMCQTQ